MNHELLNIASVGIAENTLGPGRRFIIWVQGCPFSCKNCVSKDWIPFEQAHVISISELVGLIIKHDDLTGVTISGGEPMMQAGRLRKLINSLQASVNRSLDLIVFTGFELDQLCWKEAKELKEVTDVMICGLYIDSLNDGMGLKGSYNQEIHFLTEKLKPFERYFSSKRDKVEFHISESAVSMIGIPTPKFFW
ncbi:MAG: 4Fe-4S single cluster domain-containing protein [Roseivirga sp.]